MLPDWVFHDYNNARNFAARRALGTGALVLGIPDSNTVLNLDILDRPAPPGRFDQQWFLNVAAHFMLHVTSERNVTCDAIVADASSTVRYATKLGLLIKRPVIEPHTILDIAHPVPASVKKVLVVAEFSTDVNLDLVTRMRGRGLKVTDVIVLIDDERGEKENLTKLGCLLHAVYTRSELGLLHVERREEPASKLRADTHVYLSQC